MGKCITPTEYFYTLKQVSYNVNKDDGIIKAKEKARMMTRITARERI